MISFTKYINEWKYKQSNDDVKKDVIIKYRPKTRAELDEIIYQRFEENHQDPYLLDIDVSNIKNMKSLFSSHDDNSVLSRKDCNEIERLDLESWNVSNVENMSYMFYGCRNLKEVKLNTWKTNKVRTLRCMFYECESLEQIDLSNFDTKNVLSFVDIFGYCSNLKYVNISNFNTRLAIKENICEMFWNCKSLETIVGIEDLNLSNSTSLRGMFNNCKKLKKLDLSAWDTKNINNIELLFNDCENLEEVIGLEGWVTTNITDKVQAFHKCKKQIIPSWY